MRYAQLLLWLVVSITGNTQSPNEKDYVLLNEILKDNFAGVKVQLSPSAFDNGYFNLDYGWVQQEASVLNKSLDGEEKIFILNFIDSSYCFTSKVEITEKLKLCDSSEIQLYDFFRNAKKRKGLDSIKWDGSKLKSGKGKSKIEVFQISRLVYSNTRALVLMHMVFASQDGLFGKTLLFKKVNGKWITVCALSGWVT